MSVRSSSSPRSQGFLAQHQELSEAYAALEIERRIEALAPPTASIESASTPTESSFLEKSKVQRLVELQYQLAELCIAHGSYARAIEHLQHIQRWISAHERRAPGGNSGGAPADNKGPTVAKEDELDFPPELVTVLPELKINVLTNIGTCLYRSGQPKAALATVLEAKRTVREMNSDAGGTASSTLRQLDAILTANYAVLLKSKGNGDDAEHAATMVLESTNDNQQESDASLHSARATASSVLAVCSRTKGDAQRARAYAQSAVRHAAAAPEDAHLQARTHNTLGVSLFDDGNFTEALSHFLAAYRGAKKAQDKQMQATLLYHIGRTLMALGAADIELPREGSHSTHHNANIDASVKDDLASDPQKQQQEQVERVVTSDCLARVEEVSAELRPADSSLAALGRTGHGEVMYAHGDFATAEIDFQRALERLQALVGAENRGTEFISEQELVKIQGHVECFLGCSQLMLGHHELAEATHQRDLELALDTEDIHAQHRALRNLAVVYTVSQRYQEAIPLWRETIEIATVLQSKYDLMIGLSGLGRALNELRATDLEGEFKALHEDPEHHPRRIFLRQRALAIELGDVQHQLLAQRAIVGTYETAEARDELEPRLEECDRLVRLCEQHGTAEQRALGYFALANALTAQILRLRERGQRFADAIRVLMAKRSGLAQKFRDATVEWRREQAQGQAQGGGRIGKDSREPRGRIEVIQRH